MAIPVLLAAVVATSSHGWTLAQARTALVRRVHAVTDTSQPDRPAYELVVTRRAARSLRVSSGGRFRFSGLARDTLTDTGVRVRFTFVRPGRIVAFHGPAADPSQPSLPIRAGFYYAWYPEAWSRGSAYPYSRFHPSLDFYAANDPPVIRRQTEAMRYAHLGAGIYSWWGEDGYPP